MFDQSFFLEKQERRRTQKRKEQEKPEEKTKTRKNLVDSQVVGHLDGTMLPERLGEQVPGSGTLTEGVGHFSSKKKGEKEKEREREGKRKERIF